MAGFGTFDAGNALTQGFQIGAAISKNRQANALAQAQMYGGLPLEEQVRYKQQRQMIEDSRSDTEWQQGQEDRLYGISQRPAAEERATAETEQLRASARAQAAQAAATASDQELAEASRMGQQMYGAITQTIAQMEAGDPAAWDRFEALFGEQMQGAGFDPTAVGPEHAQVIRRVFEGMMEGFDQEYTDRSIAASQQGMIAPQGAADTPAGIQELQFRAREAGLTPGTPEYQQFMQADGKVAGSDSMSLEIGPDGTLRYNAGKMTEQQSKDNVYVTKAEGALQILDPVAENLSKRGQNLLEGVPLGLGRELQTPDFQTARASGQEFLAAILRKDTGAAVTASEEDMYGRIYLPQPGDTEEVLEYRTKARRRAVEAIKSGMSPEQILATEIARQNTDLLTEGDAASQSPASNNPFASMSLAERAQVDVSTLSMDELDQYLEAVSP